MLQFKKTNIQWCVFVSNHSQRLNTGSADVDWSNWGEDWPASHDHDSQSEWTEWNDEQLTSANNSWHHAADKPHQKSSSATRKPTTKPAEKNLIDFDFDDENHHGKNAGTEAVGDGWDADVWADVDDDNWEPIETFSSKSDGKRD